MPGSPLSTKPAFKLPTMYNHNVTKNAVLSHTSVDPVQATGPQLDIGALARVCLESKLHPAEIQLVVQAARDYNASRVCFLTLTSKYSLPLLTPTPANSPQTLFARELARTDTPDYAHEDLRQDVLDLVRSRLGSQVLAPLVSTQTDGVVGLRGTEQYWCRRCKKLISGRKTLALHLEGRKHKAGPGAWVRDLTREGIEPNPGWIGPQNCIANLSPDTTVCPLSFWVEELRRVFTELTRLYPNEVVMRGDDVFFFNSFQLDPVEEDLVLPDLEPTPDDTSDFLVEGWLRDLTDEGIEPNPGWHNSVLAACLIAGVAPTLAQDHFRTSVATGTQTCSGSSASSLVGLVNIGPCKLDYWVSASTYATCAGSICSGNLGSCSLTISGAGALLVLPVLTEANIVSGTTQFDSESVTARGSYSGLCAGEVINIVCSDLSSNTYCAGGFSLNSGDINYWQSPSQFVGIANEPILVSVNNSVTLNPSYESYSYRGTPLVYTQDLNAAPPLNPPYSSVGDETASQSDPASSSSYFSSLAYFSPYEWAQPRSLWNKLMHALNGNIFKQVLVDTALANDVERQLGEADALTADEVEDHSPSFSEGLGEELEVALNDLKARLSKVKILSSSDRHLLLSLMAASDEISQLSSDKQYGVVTSADLSEDSFPDISSVATREHDAAHGRVHMTVLRHTPAAKQPKRSAPTHATGPRDDGVSAHLGTASRSQNYANSLQRLKTKLVSAEHLALWLVIQRPSHRFAKHVVARLSSRWEERHKQSWSRLVIECYLGKFLGPSCDGAETVAVLSLCGLNNDFLNSSFFSSIFGIVFKNQLDTVQNIVHDSCYKMVSGETTAVGYDAVRQAEHNASMHATNGNISDGYSALLQRQRNRSMHSLNGNTTEKMLAVNLADVRASKSMTFLKNFTGGGKPMDAKERIGRIQGLSPTYNLQTSVGIYSGILNASSITQNATVQSTFSVSPREAMFYPRYLFSASGGAPTADLYGLTWYSVGTGASRLRPYTTGLPWMQASQQIRDARLKPNSLAENNFRNEDINTLGSGFHRGSGESARPEGGGGSDSMINIGIRTGQYCICYNGLRQASTLPLAGAAIAMDSYAKLATPAVVGSPNCIPWNPVSPLFNENCGGSLTVGSCRPFFPFGANFSSILTSTACGSLRLVTTLQGLSPDELAQVVVFPANLANLYSTYPSVALAVFLALLAPGPFSILFANMTTTDVNGANPTIVNNAYMASLIVTEGMSDIIVLLPSQTGMRPPVTYADAMKSSQFTISWGPNATADIAAYTPLQISAIGLPVLVPLSGFIFSWAPFYNASLFYNVGKMLCEVTNRLDDFEAGVSLAYALGARYRPLCAGTAGAAAPVIPNATVLSRDTVCFMGVRPTPAFNTSGTFVYPLAQGAWNANAYDVMVPGFSASWLSAVLCGAIVPESYSSVNCLTLAPLLLQPECWDGVKLFVRCLTCAYQVFFTAAQKPATFWNSLRYAIVTTGGSTTYNEYAGSNAELYQTWRLRMRRLFCSTSTKIPMYAPAIATIEKILGEVCGLSLPRDSYKNEILGYFNIPNGSIYSPDPSGSGTETLPAFAGLKDIVNARWTDSAAYIPTTLTDLEMYSVMDMVPKGYQMWPRPFNGDNYGLAAEGAMTQIVANSGSSYISLPVRNPGLLVQGSDDDVRNNDEEIFSLRAALATTVLGGAAGGGSGASSVYMRYLDGTPIVFARQTMIANTTGNTGSILVPLLMQTDNTPGTGVQSYLYSATAFWPSIDITGKRWAPFVLIAQASILSQWFAGKIHLVANTLLFNRCINPVIPLLGHVSTDDLTEEESASEKNAEGDTATPA